MDIAEIVELILCITVCGILLFFLIIFITKINLSSKLEEKITKIVREEIEVISNNTFSKEEFSIDELNYLIREKEYDERISRMRKELLNRQSTVAEELHPNVHNLPHNIIPDTYIVGDKEEVAL